MTARAGRHFLQIPGPSNVPDRILRAIDAATIDHRGPAFAELGQSVLTGMRRLFDTESRVVIFPSSGTGAWEAALVNTLSPGDRVLFAVSGHFAATWAALAGALGLDVVSLEGDWRSAVEPERIAETLAADREHRIKALAVVHNETSTGVLSDIAAVRAALDAAGHPALLLVDAISSLGTVPYHHDAWSVDVSVCGSQKGLMLPPGLSFNAVSEQALSAAAAARLPRYYWDWEAMRGPNRSGYFPYTPATNLLYGLREAIAMLEEEGLAHVFARHARLAEATRHAVTTWGLTTNCRNESEHSPALTAVRMPDGHSADTLREVILEAFDMSLGNGLARLSDRVFRIGHLGDFNELMLAGTLCGVQMGLGLARVPHRPGGVEAALAYLGSAREGGGAAARPAAPAERVGA